MKIRFGPNFNLGLAITLVATMLTATSLTAEIAIAEDGAEPVHTHSQSQTPLSSLHYSGSNTYGRSPMSSSPIWRYHPRPLYAHSLRGIHSERVDRWNADQAAVTSWHGQYYHRQWGQPLALVVPPTASFQTNYSWGVGGTTSMPINHQFGRPYPGNPTGVGGQAYRRTPAWPSSTNQFGIYPVRGPW